MIRIVLIIRTACTKSPRDILWSGKCLHIKFPDSLLELLFRGLHSSVQLSSQAIKPKNDFHVQ